MNIDIWSDIMCPFCYIGKRKLEGALAQLPPDEPVTITWHSYQLDPEMEAQPGKDLYTYLADRKGQTREWSVQMHEQVSRMATAAGLTYRFDQAVLANSFDAHRLIQLAKTQGLGDAAEERLFRAYFTDGEDVGDHETLVRIGREIGLEGEEVRQALATGAFSEEVYADIAAAQQLGVRGVPFFVINERYGISGAQPEEVFLRTMQQAKADNKMQ